MTVGRVTTYVDADLGENGLSAAVVEARDGPYDLGSLAKGVEAGLHLLADPRDRPIEGVDLLEMELEQEAVMSRQAAAQRLAKLLSRGSDPPVRQSRPRPPDRSGRRSWPRLSPCR